MPKKKAPPLTPEEQRKRFEALARQAGAQGSAKQFKETLGRVLTAKGRASKRANLKAK